MEVALYDLLGSKIQVVQMDDLQKGSHKIDLDTEHLAIGTYLLKISDGTQMLSRKLLHF